MMRRSRRLFESAPPPRSARFRAAIQCAHRAPANSSAKASGANMRRSPVPPAALIDTGAILALVDRGDEWHESCVAAYNRSRLPLLTTEAVLTEVFHLMHGDRRQITSVWTLLRSGAVQISPIPQDELRHVHTLMEDYADRPMDFADA